MPRQKRSSRTLLNAEQRAASLGSIGTNLSFGEGISLTEYNQLIDDLRNEIISYNQALSSIDKAANAIEAFERQLQDLSERLLTGVATVYGKHSSEYEMAGGVRKSDRKRPVRRTPTLLSAQS